MFNIVLFQEVLIGRSDRYLLLLSLLTSIFYQ